jgi:hypothetical protein
MATAIAFIGCGALCTIALWRYWAPLSDFLRIPKVIHIENVIKRIMTKDNVSGYAALATI